MSQTTKHLGILLFQDVEELDDVVTSAGVSACVDMALHLVDRLAGTERAREVRRRIQYDPAPPV